MHFRRSIFWRSTARGSVGGVFSSWGAARVKERSRAICLANCAWASLKAAARMLSSVTGPSVRHCPYWADQTMIIRTHSPSWECVRIYHYYPEYILNYKDRRKLLSLLLLLLFCIILVKQSSKKFVKISTEEKGVFL